MKKRLMSIGIVLVVIVAIVFVNIFKDAQGPYPKGKHIEINEILEMKDHYYYVYLYQSNDEESKKLEDTMNEALKKYDNLYFVNLDDQDDKFELFDWTTFHSENDIEIGQTINGQDTFYPGESEEKYQNSEEVNQYGIMKEYSIVETDEDYKKVNKNAKDGYIYAKLITPEIDFKQCIADGKLILPGMPTLLVVWDNEVEDVQYGYFNIMMFRPFWSK